MTAPYQPSILDRVVNRLFPTAQYTGLLSPEAQRDVQRQGLLGLGTSLLQAGAPQPYQGGTLANLGAALQQSQLSFPQMAHQALQLQAYKGQLAERQAVAQAAEKHPAQPNETQQQAYNRFTQIIAEVASLPGGVETAAKLAPVLNALKPPSASERGDWAIQPAEGADGKIHLVRVNRLTGETKDTGLFGKTAPPKEPTPAERVASSQYGSAAGSVSKLEEIAQRNPAAAKEAVAAIKAARYGKLGTLYSELRGQLSSQDAQDFYTNYNNALLAVTPTYGGARPTQQLLDLEKAATLPAIGSGDFQIAFAHLHGRLKDLKAKAGKAFEEPNGTTPAGKYRATNPFAPP